MTALSDPTVYQLAFIYVMLNLGTFGMGMFLPQILKSAGKLSNAATGWVSAIPYACAAAAMVFVGARSDQNRAHRLTIVGGAVAAATGFALTAIANGIAPVVLGFSIAAMGMWSMLGPFWSLATATVSGRAAPAGIAFINSVGALGGFIGPWVFGAMQQSSGGVRNGLLMLASALLVGGLTALALREPATVPELDRAVVD